MDKQYTSSGDNRSHNRDYYRCDNRCYNDHLYTANGLPDYEYGNRECISNADNRSGNSMCRCDSCNERWRARRMLVAGKRNADNGWFAFGDGNGSISGYNDHYLFAGYWLHSDQADDGESVACGNNRCYEYVCGSNYDTR